MSHIKQKKCEICEKTKSVELFYKRDSNKDKYQAICKECVSLYGSISMYEKIQRGEALPLRDPNYNIHPHTPYKYREQQIPAKRTSPAYEERQRAYKDKVAQAKPIKSTPDLSEYTHLNDPVIHEILQSTHNELITLQQTYTKQLNITQNYLELIRKLLM